MEFAFIGRSVMLWKYVDIYGGSLPAFLKRKRGYYALWFENILFRFIFGLFGAGIVDTELELGSMV